MQEPTTPSIARIYDYWLGGSHNFPVDRAVGKQMEQLMPFVTQGLTINRWFVGYAGRRMTQAGVSRFLDLGAGLPTEGALHEHVPAAAKVLYNDFDPETVAYGQRILQDEHGNPARMRFVQGRIEEIDPILAAAETFFGQPAPIGICMIAVVHFIDDDALSRVAQRLYDWAAPGSILAVTTSQRNLDDPVEQAALDGYQQRTGVELYFRRPEQLAQLLAPWTAADGGFQRLEEFAEADLGRQHIVLPDYRGKVGYGGFLYRS
jgi:O-methyltransferase involved in polyketide biosynthesis